MNARITIPISFLLHNKLSEQHTLNKSTTVKYQKFQERKNLVRNYDRDNTHLMVFEFIDYCTRTHSYQTDPPVHHCKRYYKILRYVMLCYDMLYYAM